MFIVGARRSAFGSFGGSLKGLNSTQLGAAVAKNVLEAAGVNPQLVDATVVGNVAQTDVDAAYIARHVGLQMGGRIDSTALTVNRLCGSGFQAVVSAAHEILVEKANIVMAVGAENMSQAPYSVRGDNVRFGTRLGNDLVLKDSLWSALTDSHIKTPMAITAENLAEKYGLTRQDCDEYALSSQQRWANAQKNGVFDAEIAAIQVKGKKGPQDFTVDEHPRPTTTIESLSKLPAVFKKDGVVSAGNASGISDGAGALILASEAAVKEHGLKPLARLVSWHSSGVAPEIMGIGPVTAINGALGRAGLSVGDIDLFEINEAFAAQYLACEKELGLDRAKSNVNGGAIALGHPLAASGSRITAHLVHQLIQTKSKYAVGSACIGGGQGIALVLENATL